MSIVYWQGTGTTVATGDFYGQPDNPDGYWSATPASGDTAIMGRGSETINGGGTAEIPFEKFVIGRSFTGSIGSVGSVLPFAAHGQSGAFHIHPGGGDLYISLDDDPTTSANGSLTIDIFTGAVYVVDYRSLDQKDSDYSHTVSVVMRTQSASVSVLQAAGAAAYTQLVATGARGSTLTISGSTAEDIFTDGPDVVGGTALSSWSVLNGAIEPLSAANLSVYGGSATPGRQGADGDFPYIDLYGGAVDVSSMESATDLPGNWADLEVFSGTLKMLDTQKVVNRGDAVIEIVGGGTVRVDTAIKGWQ